MIWCIGESLYDVVFSDGQPVWAVPGGSMLNVAVSAARFGAKVGLITETGDDAVGNMINGFLEQNGISTKLIHHYKGNTTLALAFLNAAGDARYQFYHHAPKDAPVFDIPDFQQGDVLVFGSFYSINPRNRDNIKRLTTAARSADAWIYYDPNFRQPHLSGLPQSLPFIKENLACADVVRGSDEDFNLIAGARTPQEACRFVADNGCRNFILTRNKAGVDLFTEAQQQHFSVPAVEVVSTIGAGDSFNAGFVSSLHGLKKNELISTFWEQAIGRAVIFASEVCQSRDNFIGKQNDSPVNI